MGSERVCGEEDKADHRPLMLGIRSSSVVIRGRLEDPDNQDLVRGIFPFHNMDMKVHNNPVVEEQFAAGEDNQQDEDQEEPGLMKSQMLSFICICKQYNRQYLCKKII